jgi:hypothetical protein
MDWPEIEKKIADYLATNWTATEIFWPGQSVRPSGNDWIEIHWLDTEEEYRRNSGPGRGSILFQISIFSRVENVFATGTLYKTLVSKLHQKNFKSTNYQIRFEEMAGTNIPWRGQDNIEKNVNFKACTIKARVWEVI